MVFVCDKMFAAARALSLLLVVSVVLREVLSQLEVVQEDSGAVRTFSECGWNGDDAAGGSMGWSTLHCTSLPRAHLKDSRRSADSTLCPSSPAAWSTVLST